MNTFEKKKKNARSLQASWRLGLNENTLKNQYGIVSEEFVGKQLKYSVK